MKINRGAKTGIMIEIVAFVIMMLLVLLNKPIPNIVFWIFVLGLVIALAGTLAAYSERVTKQ
ncbi:hypothetical protein [Dethiobacter alkaliphilus]|uniref:hypothetical protein n=1 Tax=Dethiobacter alkaliphilus TaxID=427926 RepID=UPI002227C832|nr:hypothetical protein [Dethiobacter alkaliphilus]MCW3491709.1 hypothetical protein [Dethiobacter alkaliphilus]